MLGAVVVVAVDVEDSEGGFGECAAIGLELFEQMNGIGLTQPRLSFGDLLSK